MHTNTETFGNTLGALKAQRNFHWVCPAVVRGHTHLSMSRRKRHDGAVRKYRQRVDINTDGVFTLFSQLSLWLGCF